MATQYTRTYTYTGQSNNNGRRNVAWTKFTVSGDTTHAIGQIVSITYEHYHTSTGSPTWTLKGRLILGDGSYIDSDEQSHKFSSDLYKYSNTFTTLPTAEQFAMITAVQTIANDTDESTSISGGSLYWRATASEPMKVIVTFVEEPPTYYGPAVDTFSLTRVNADGVASDEGVYLRMDVKLSLLDDSNKSNSVVRIYYSTTPTIDTSTDPYLIPDLTIDQMLSGIYGNTQAISLTFSNGSKWYFALVFICGDEVGVGNASIGRAFASLHISPCSTGGVAVGGFSSSTEGNPKFEVYNPIYAYGGFAQIGEGSGSLLELMGIQKGSVEGSVSVSGEMVDYEVTFDRPYSDAPVVVVGMMLGGALAENYYSARLSVALMSASATGFKVRTYNYSGSSGKANIGFAWAAFGTIT